MFFGAGFGGVVSFIKGGMEPRWGKNRLEGRGGFDTLIVGSAVHVFHRRTRLPIAHVAQQRTPIDSDPIDRVFKGVNPCLIPPRDNPEPGSQPSNVWRAGGSPAVFPRPAMAMTATPPQSR